jgi:hypothetical protein
METVTRDWIPGSRNGILAMVKNHISYMTAERRTAWGIPQDRFIEYGTAYAAAQAALAKVENTPERNHVDTVVCNEAFDTLRAVMRFFRKHYFLIPPLTLADWAELGFRDPDTTPSVIPAPGDVPQVTPEYVQGAHVLGFVLGPLPGTQALDGSSDYGYALYVAVMPQGGATLEQAASIKHYLREIPADGEPLRHHCFTRRRRGEAVFDASEAGMTAYFCARYENQKGWVGHWGPVTSAIIP